MVRYEKKNVRFPVLQGLNIQNYRFFFLNNILFDGQYTTDIITNESVRIIRSHNASNPLFLYIAHAAVHSGNPYNPLPAPDSITSKFTYISDFARRKYAGE